MLRKSAIKYGLWTVTVKRGHPTPLEELIPPSPGRGEAQDLAVRLVSQEVDRAIRSLAHVADACTHWDALLTRHPLPIEHQAHEGLGGEPTDEQVPAPDWEDLARVKCHAGRRDHWGPVVDRLR